MGAHALGAAAYAAKAAGLAAPDQADAVSEEIRWQLGRMSAAARDALRQLPPVGENSSGPLGPGLLASGLLGTIVRDLQASLADPDAALPAGSQTNQEDGKQAGQGAEAQATHHPAEVTFRGGPTGSRSGRGRPKGSDLGDDGVRECFWS